MSEVKYFGIPCLTSPHRVCNCRFASVKGRTNAKVDKIEGKCGMIIKHEIRISPEICKSMYPWIWLPHAPLGLWKTLSRA